MPRTRHRSLRLARIAIKRTLRTLDREPPEWLRWLAPWGTSLALHAAFLLVLAIVVQALGSAEKPHPAAFSGELGGQLVDDVTSLRDADRGGDPFTRLDSVDPPSLSPEPRPNATEIISVPKLSPSVAIGPDLNLIPKEMGTERTGPGSGKPRVDLRNGGGTSEGQGAFDANASKTAPFSGRSDEMKAKLVRREGGTAESEKAVEQGLDWIARHQRADGAWSLDTVAMCVGAPCPEAPCMDSDSAATGLAILPILAAGHVHNRKGRYQSTLQRGIAWLVKTQGKDGELFTGGGQHTLYYSHAIAAMALCEAYGVSGDKRLREPAQKAINYIQRSQNRVDGGWRYEFNQAGDTSVFGWQIFALRSAHLAGLEVNKATLRRCRGYLDNVVTDPVKATYAYMPGWAMSPSMTAEGLVCRQLLGWPRDHPAMLTGTAIIADHLEESQQRNIYYWYYATQLLHNMKGKDWVRWNARVRDGLISMQRGGEGCDRGSWDPHEPQPDLWGDKGGRLYTTSLSLLTLEVYYRYLPLYRDRGGDGDDRDGTDLVVQPPKVPDAKP